jgi:hypothetical protein
MLRLPSILTCPGEVRSRDWQCDLIKRVVK